MSRYQITTSLGADLGIYSGDTPEDAIETMDRTAGYASSADAAAVLGTTIEYMRAGLTVVEISEETP